ncbi:MAG: citramalate synthase, partial [Arenibacterium sp.]
MSRERLYLYDTTLRAGQQTPGVQFSTADKVQITQARDGLLIVYLVGGRPGANPTDS